MVAAICLVGINAIFSGGYSSRAVLQSWSMLVSPKLEAEHASGAAVSWAGHDGVDRPVWSGPSLGDPRPKGWGSAV